MSSSLVIVNRQRTRPLQARLLRRIIRDLLEQRLRLQHYDLGVSIVAAAEMEQVNRRFLNHEGSTDVITFNYGEERDGPAVTGSNRSIHGELFVCMDDAVLQAREFSTTWQAELVRYVTHGILHLLGYDDLDAAVRRVMKREEDRLVKQLEADFDLAALEKQRSAT